MENISLIAFPLLLILATTIGLFLSRIVAEILAVAIAEKVRPSAWFAIPTLVFLLLGIGSLYMAFLFEFWVPNWLGVFFYGVIGFGFYSLSTAFELAYRDFKEQTWIRRDAK